MKSGMRVGWHAFWAAWCIRLDLPQVSQVSAQGRGGATKSEGAAITLNRLIRDPRHDAVDRPLLGQQTNRTAPELAYMATASAAVGLGQGISLGLAANRLYSLRNFKENL